VNIDGVSGVRLDIRFESAGGGKEFLGGGGDGGEGGVAGLHAVAAAEDEVFVCAGEGLAVPSSSWEQGEN